MTPTAVIPGTAAQPASAMSPQRKLAIATGVLFFITHVTSVAAIILYQPVLNRPGYVLGNGAANSRILLGGLLEVVLAAAVIGTAVTLYPVVSRHNRALAMGYVGLRTLEAGLIVTGIVSLLAVVSLQHDVAVPLPTPPLLRPSARRSWPSTTGRSSSGPGWSAA